MLHPGACSSTPEVTFPRVLTPSAISANQGLDLRQDQVARKMLQKNCEFGL